MKLNKKTNKGFTIIEVMIVLAVVGLILGIVLIAAPNLTRNSRNNQIRSDANNLLGYYSDYVTNNNGAAPGSICYNSTDGSVGMSSSTSCATTYDATKTVGKIRAGTTWSTAAIPTTLSAQTLYVQLGKKCDGTSSGRSLSITFGVETTAASPTSNCIEG